ncbi:hypothetical protein JMN32_07815 [Fulvivirga sp. 29W222]|uniref:Type 1 periplasmic binding fold superfamily protein n=1 Tax=Fulvivirga marina TaxID=2494733 RepID=A0A937KDM3_9BACT|nr:hypothetical protein [Fulvivirga marina]MBL6446210.1 hypothetical protein [Fulvivirga marina]
MTILKSNFLALLLLASAVFMTACSDDDAPEAENEEEVINEVTLTFTPVAGGTPLAFTYNDPDGDGTLTAEQDDIMLSANTIYSLAITLKNTVGGNNENITEEVKNEGIEHQIFFGWTGALFSSPTGLGNIGAGNQVNTLNYQDEDANGLPIGLATVWETATPTIGTFRILLKHQPDIKSASSSSEDGETDVDLQWNIEIK